MMDQRNADALVAEIELLQDRDLIKKVLDMLIARSNELNGAYAYIKEIRWSADHQMHQSNHILVNVSADVVFTREVVAAYIKVDPNKMR